MMDDGLRVRTCVCLSARRGMNVSRLHGVAERRTEKEAMKRKEKRRLRPKSNSTGRGLCLSYPSLLVATIIVVVFVYLTSTFMLLRPRAARANGVESDGTPRPLALDQWMKLSEGDDTDIRTFLASYLSPRRGDATNEKDEETSLLSSDIADDCSPGFAYDWSRRECVPDMQIFTDCLSDVPSVRHDLTLRGRRSEEEGRIGYQFAWAECFNRCEEAIAPVWNLHTKEYHEDFEKCHCTCYGLSHTHVDVRLMSSRVGSSIRRRDAERVESAIRPYVTFRNSWRTELWDRVFSIARDAAEIELRTSLQILRRLGDSNDQAAMGGDGEVVARWQGGDGDPCLIGYAQLSKRTFWAGGCSWGKGRCGRRVHPGWNAACLSRGLRPLVKERKFMANFLRDYLTPTKSLHRLKVINGRFKDSRYDQDDVLRLVTRPHDNISVRTIDIATTSAGIPVPVLREEVDVAFWKKYVITEKGKGSNWIYQYWHDKLTVFHSKTVFSNYLANVEGIPTTFFLPEEFDVGLRNMKKCTQCRWIYKPSHGSGGYGVRMVTKDDVLALKDEFERGEKKRRAVLQRAITSLLIDDGRKFDLRVYVVVPSWKPLVAFILPDALVRLAYRKYEDGTTDKCATRTNTAQRSACAVEDEDIDAVTHNRTLLKSKYVWRLAALGDDIDRTFGRGKWEEVWRDVKRSIRHMLIALATRYRPQFVDTGARNFHTLGVDVMIDESLKPWIIEANQRPDDNSYCTKDHSPFLQGVPVATFARRTLELLGFPRYPRATYCPSFDMAKQFCGVEDGRVDPNGTCVQSDFENILWLTDMLRSQGYDERTKKLPASDASLQMEPLVPLRGDAEIWDRYALRSNGKRLHEIPHEDRALMSFIEFSTSRGA